MLRFETRRRNLFAGEGSTDRVCRPVCSSPPRVSSGQFHRFTKCSTFASTSVFSRKLVNGQSRIMLGIGGDESFTRNVCKELDEVWEERKEGRKR